MWIISLLIQSWNCAPDAGCHIHWDVPNLSGAQILPYENQTLDLKIFSGIGKMGQSIQEMDQVKFVEGSL